MVYNREYEVGGENNLNASFLSYFQALADKRKNSFGNYGNWDSTLKHLKKYAKERDVSFAEISPKWVEGFKEYLEHQAKKKDNNTLTQNSKVSYFRKLKAALAQAVKDEIIKKNPAINIQGFKEGDSQRAYLTLEELQALVQTPCELPLIKKSFLFSCLTGLRHSDIKGLKWGQIEYSQNEGYTLGLIYEKLGYFTTGYQGRFTPLSGKFR